MRKTIKEELTQLLVGKSCRHTAGFQVTVTSLSWYGEKCLYHGRTDSGAQFAGAIASLEETQDFVKEYPDLSESEAAYLKTRWGDPPLTVPEQMRADKEGK